jgi:hypothetical protein
MKTSRLLFAVLLGGSLSGNFASASPIVPDLAGAPTASGTNFLSNYNLFVPAYERLDATANNSASIAART